MWAHDAQRQGRGVVVGPDDPVLMGAPWPYTAKRRVLTSVAIDYNGTAYFGTEAGALEAVTALGGSAFTYDTGGSIYASPAIVTEGTGPARRGRGLGATPGRFALLRRR